MLLESNEQLATRGKCRVTDQRVHPRKDGRAELDSRRACVKVDLVERDAVALLVPTALVALHLHAVVGQVNQTVHEPHLLVLAGALRGLLGVAR